jgi:hypothetical protein
MLRKTRHAAFESLEGRLLLTSGFVPLLVHGPASNRVNAFFLGDGYTAANLAAGAYTSDIQSYLDYMFADSTNSDPFYRYRNFFNAYRVDVVSNQSGADEPQNGIVKDTALDASYRWDGVTDRLLYINDTKADNILNAAVSGSGITPEMRFVAVNDSIYGGGGGKYTVFAAPNTFAREIALHELGHSFSHLADEYDTGGPAVYSGPEPSEVDVTTDASGAKWARWLGYDDPTGSVVGAYEGAKYSTQGIYRPTLDSKMRTLAVPFNAVSREKIILDIYNLVHPLDSYTDNASQLLDPTSLSVTRVDDAVIATQWFVDGSLDAAADGQSQLDVGSLGLTPGEHSIEIRAFDPTAFDPINGWVRTDNNKLEQTVTWDIMTDDLPPTADDLSLVTNRNTSVGGQLIGHDADSAALTFSVINAPQHGQLTSFDPATGSFVYQPDGGYFGNDSFTFAASDGTFDSIAATASITVLPNASVPTADDSSVSTDQDTSFNGQLVGHDADGNPLTFSIVEAPHHGTLASFDATTGSFVYAPNHSYRGADSFTFTASNGVFESNQATASVTVNPVDPFAFDVDSGLVIIKGTNGADTIIITPSGDAKSATVVLNGQVVGRPVPLASISRITVFGRGGDDTAKITNLSIPIVLDGGDGNNTLVVNGRATANAFVLNGDSLLVNGAEYDLTNLENLKVRAIGTSDAFTAQSIPGNIQVTVVGGTTTTLIGQTVFINTWNITADNSGTLAADGTLNFINVPNLTGSDNGVDSFVFAKGKKVTGRVDGGAGGGLLDLSSYTTPVMVNLQKHTATGTGRFKNIIGVTPGSSPNNTLVASNQANSWFIGDFYADSLETADGRFFTFQNFHTLIGGSGNDVFSLVELQPGDFVGKLDGGNGNNTLIGLDGNNTWRITSKNGGRLAGTPDNEFPPSLVATFANIQNLTGRSADDDFILSAGAGIAGHLDGGPGGHNVLDYSKYTTSVRVNLATGAATNIFTGAAGGVSNIAIVLGGSAGDWLTGGSENAVLVGGAGKDKLTGGSGRNILMGGGGADTLVGGPDEDVLFNGKTDLDADVSTIDFLFDDWTGGDDFATRVANLREGSALGVFPLNFIIHDDASSDILTGGAGLDWFFAKLPEPAADSISDLDLVGGEQLN